MDKHFQRLWDFVKQGQDLPMEVSLFRLMTLSVALLCTFVVIPINLMEALPPFLNQMIALYTLSAIFLYRKSCRGRYFIKTFYILTLSMLSAAWLLNGGSHGSVEYYFVGIVILPMVFYRGVTRQLMFLLAVLDHSTLLLLEHWHPELVTPYETANARLIDLVTGFPFSTLLCALWLWVVLTTLERELDERKRAELSLAENEKTLKMLMDFMPSGIWWYSDEGKIEYLNHRFAELFGYALQEIPTLLKWYEASFPDGRDREVYLQRRNDAVDEARKNGISVIYHEAKITCKDGSVKHVIINTQFMLGRTIEIFTDITERELLQGQMIRMQKLESLGVLAGGIAHDFNNILTSIIGNVSLAEMLVDPNDQVHACLERAEKASMRAGELAKQLLTFAKGGEPVKAPILVTALIDESLSLSLRGSNVQGVNLLPRDLGIIEADEGQLSQVFNNLMINAVHAMPQGGTLTIDGENTTLPAGNDLNLPGGSYIKLTFADEGVGIPEPNLKKIFDPYFTTKSRGTGLGLASTHSIIIRHGGNISVRSSLGMGTTFTLYLPTTANPAVRKRQVSKSASQRTRAMAILVMDDDDMIRAYAAEMLRNFGYEVQTCASGEEAITHYGTAIGAGRPFAAAVLDLTVAGGMGGKETAEELLAIDREARLIVSSGYSDAPTMSAWGSYGFRAFLAKPYLSSDLLQVIESVTVRHGHSGEEAA